MTLTERVRLVVLESPSSTIRQVLARVGRFIPATSAVRQGEKTVCHGHRRGAEGLRSPIYTLAHLAEIGRKQTVRYALKKLTRSGRVRRISPGVYGPPLPNLFEPAPRAGA